MVGRVDFFIQFSFVGNSFKMFMRAYLSLVTVPETDTTSDKDKKNRILKNVIKTVFLADLSQRLIGELMG